MCLKCLYYLFHCGIKFMQPSSHLLCFNYATYYLEMEDGILVTLELFYFKIKNPLNMDHQLEESFDMFEDMKRGLNRFMHA